MQSGTSLPSCPPTSLISSVSFQGSHYFMEQRVADNYDVQAFGASVNISKRYLLYSFVEINAVEPI